jgi:hypothetical protein
MVMPDQKMLVMIREIKQAARRILAWVFDDWRELHGYGERSLQFVFNGLDLSDAVDFKRLLIELYDRKPVSRSSLPMKMDLDPEIETANWDTERHKIDLLDEKAVKPIVEMVMAGILTVEAAQAMLGIEPAPMPGASSMPTAASWGGLSVNAGVASEVCDGCVHFVGDANRCRVHRSERFFDSPACRFFEARTASASASETQPPATKRPCGCGA